MLKVKITIFNFRKVLHSGTFQFNNLDEARNYSLGLFEGFRIMKGEPTGIKMKKVK